MTFTVFLYCSISDSVHSVHQDPIQHFSWWSKWGVSVPSSGARDQPSAEDGGGGPEAAGASQSLRIHNAYPHYCSCCCFRRRGRVLPKRSFYLPRDLQHLQLQQQSGYRLWALGDGVVILIWAGPGFSAQRAGCSQLLWKACRYAD